MNSLKKMLAGVILGVTVWGSAMAASQMSMPPAYGTRQDLTAGLQRHGFTPAVINNTDYDYWVYSTYYPSGWSYKTYLGPYGAATDIIYYPINFPDIKVCFHIDNTYYPYETIYEGCSYISNVYIDYNYLGLKQDKSSKPVVKLDPAPKK